MLGQLSILQLRHTDNTHTLSSDEEQYLCDIWCMYIGLAGLIDGYSALGVVYNVSLEVVMTIRAG